jgi:hypothetical protein
MRDFLHDPVMLIVTAVLIVCVAILLFAGTRESDALPDGCKKVQTGYQFQPNPANGNGVPMPTYQIVCGYPTEVNP